MVKTNLICFNCGTNEDVVKGSIRHPCCKKCFRILFNNDWKKYEEKFNKEHPVLIVQIIKNLFNRY